MRKFQAALLIALNAATIVLILAWALWDNRYSIWPIHIVHSSEPLTPTIKVGETLRIRATITRMEICSPTVVRFVYRLHDGGSHELVKVASAPGAALGIGKRMEGIIPIPATEALDPGCYEIGGYVSNVCGSRTVTTSTKPYRFCVEQ